jgi:hypothetical protein
MRIIKSGYTIRFARVEELPLLAQIERLPTVGYANGCCFIYQYALCFFG